MPYEPNPDYSCLFIDFNAYFASVEQHDEPALRSRPVMVIPLQSDHSGAIAASYEARPYGIKRGTTPREARRLCPHIAIRTARHDRYIELHKQLMAQIEQHLALHEIYSVDEAAFLVPPKDRSIAAGTRLATQIMHGIAHNISPALRASIGIAQTPLLAKIAAESHKPDGLTLVAKAQLPAAFEAIPLPHIPGIGAGIFERLERCGIHTFTQLWGLSPKHARRIWGSVEGERFLYALHGYPVMRGSTKTSSMGHARVLQRPYDQPDKARLVARALLLKAASRLRLSGHTTGALTLSVKFRDQGRREATARFAHSRDTYVLLARLEEVWHHLLKQFASLGQPIRLKSVSIALHGLTEQMHVQRQGDLFADPETTQERHSKEALWAAIDAINADPDGKIARLGRTGTPSARGGQTLSRHVYLASQQGVDLHYLGTKIAFGRVPDRLEFDV